MNKIIIALGLTFAASTGAFAQPVNDYVELNAPVHGPTAEEYAAEQGGIDYTATASFDRSAAADNGDKGYTELQFNR